MRGSDALRDIDTRSEASGHLSHMAHVAFSLARTGLNLYVFLLQLGLQTTAGTSKEQIVHREVLDMSMECHGITSIRFISAKAINHE